MAITIPQRTKAVEAIQEMKAAGLRYTGDPLPLIVTTRLTLATKCLECGLPHTTSLRRMREGHRCKHPTPVAQALKEIEVAGLRYTDDGLPDLVGVKLPFLTECTVCGSPRTVCLEGLRSGDSCRHRIVTTAVAWRWARLAGWKPRGPYPGSRAVPWKVACVLCSYPARHPLTDLLKPDTACPCRERAEEMRAAGFEPQIPYPGSVRKPWPSLCTTCKSLRTPCLMTVRSGKRCAHRRTPYHKVPDGTGEPSGTR
ncbi:hypothetical protein [Streptomyces griseorubiginosus]|uniref:hypothetical protein n=1 Tax=Streptomyces griseorubiginosus TaxID=67304 RepID=UPI0036E547CB